MSDNELKIKITADAEGVKSGSETGAAAFENAAQRITTSVEGMNGVLSKFGALLAGVLSVGAIKSAIDAATSYNASILSLSRVMGQTTEQASVLATAIKIIGGSTEEYAAMNMRLGMHIKSNAEALEQLGVQLKDGNGNLLTQTEIFDNAIKAMAEYKEGADRNQFALYAFGRGAAEVYKYLYLTQGVMKQATDVANTYGLVVGTQAAQQTKEFSYQLNILDIIFDAVKIKIGNEVLPSVVSLAGAMGDFASTVLPSVMGAVKAFLTVFEGLSLSVKMAGAAIIGTLYAIGDVVASVAKAVVQIVHGDFQGAWDTMKGGFKDAQIDMKATNDMIVADAEKSAKRLEAIWMPSGAKGSSAAGPGKGTKSFEAPDTKKPKEDKSRMAEWRDELEKQKMDEKAYFDFSTTREKEYWQTKLTLTKAGSAEAFEVKHQIFELEKKDAQTEITDAEKQIQTEITLAEKSTAAKSKALDAKYQLGKISASQQITDEKKLQDDLYAEEMKHFKEWEALAEKYPQVWQSVQDKMRLASEKHDDAISTLNNKLQLETKKTYDSLFQPLQTALDTSVKGIILGTTTISKAISNMGVSILSSFVDMLGKMLMNWIKNSDAMAAVQEGFNALMVALGIQNTADKAAIETVSATESITKSAAVGAAATYADVCEELPYGWLYGAAIAAAAGAAIMGFSASAAGGYDIPAGINPVTQLHSQEMVLPADLANNVRNMTGGGGRGGGSTFIFNGVLDAKQLTSGHGRQILKGLSSTARGLGIRR
jgi:hypothetical protein